MCVMGALRRGVVKRRRKRGVRAWIRAMRSEGFWVDDEAEDLGGEEAYVRREILRMGARVWLWAQRKRGDGEGRPDGIVADIALSIA
jgi:hypothetical protein